MVDKAYLVVEYIPRKPNFEKMIKKFTGRNLNHCWQQKDWFAKHFFEEHGISIWSAYQITEIESDDKTEPILDWDKIGRIQQNKAAQMRNRIKKRRNRK